LSAAEQRALEAAFGEGVYEVYEGGNRLVVVPKLRLPPDAEPVEAFAIYHASPHSGYQTRLFLEVPIRGANGQTPQTSTAVLCGRTMYAASFNGVPADLPPHQGILAHLRLYEAAP
jgi:hypothetical protein